MKKTILLAVAFFTLGFFQVNAQESAHHPKSPVQIAAEKTKALSEQIKLSPDQEKAVTQVFLNTAIRMQAIQDKKEKTTKEELMQQQDARLHVVLSQDQYEKYMTLKTNNRLDSRKDDKRMEHPIRK
jgi:hypothetical protein